MLLTTVHSKPKRITVGPLTKGQSLLEKLALGMLDDHIPGHPVLQEQQEDTTDNKEENDDWLKELEPIKEPVEIIDERLLHNVEERLTKLSEELAKEATYIIPIVKPTPNPVTPIPPMLVRQESDAIPAVQTKEIHYQVGDNQKPVDAINAAITNYGRQQNGRCPVCIKVSGKFILPLAEDMQKVGGIQFYGRYACIAGSGEVRSLPIIIDERLSLAPNRIICL